MKNQAVDAEAEMGEAIAFYHETYLERGLETINFTAKLGMRARYIEDVKRNPVALWQICQWWEREGRDAFSARNS